MTIHHDTCGCFACRPRHLPVTKKKVCVSFDTQHLTALQLRAQSEGRSYSSVLDDAITQYLALRGPKGA